MPTAGFLSLVVIDADKDWNGKRISHIAQISVGDILFANNWRFTEVENGIALMDERGRIFRRWVNA